MKVIEWTSLGIRNRSYRVLNRIKIFSQTKISVDHQRVPKSRLSEIKNSSKLSYNNILLVKTCKINVLDRMLNGFTAKQIPSDTTSAV